MPSRKLPAAEWVKAVRDSLHLTQEAFAPMIKRGRSAVAKWETGKARPRYDSIEQIRRVAPPELREVGVIQDKNIPVEDDGPPSPDDAPATPRSLIRVINKWADDAGIPRPLDDNDFFDALIDAYADYRRKLAKGGQK